MYKTTFLCALLLSSFLSLNLAKQETKKETGKPLNVTGIVVENVTFSPSVKPPGFKKTLFLGGAGVRGLDVNGTFVKYSVIGVYLENNSVPWLAAKWKGKTAEELTESNEFFTDIITGPFVKFTIVTIINHLTGPEYVEKVAENSVAIMKSWGKYREAEAKATDKFIEVFKVQDFPPGDSILFTQLPKGSLVISFTEDGSIPEVGNAVIKNRPLSEAVLESIIGEGGVSPATRKSLAERLSTLFGK